ncbi:hypothetical protein [Hallella colorans]|jgi:hypothetical protein|uniref:hypothetical protein n=1 Tax=Hallella colorans TaxID=1703337 RepID=UPI0023F4CD99|nr:hypothetical protein [Hallella colorans]
MARQKNDGRGRIGGRSKGTPNKVTSTIKDWISQIIDDNREQVEKDLRKLSPKDRLQVFEKLMQYVIPKQQSVRADIDLSKLSETQIDLIVEELTKNINYESED